MKIFEIHITGESDINKELTTLGIKNIIIDLLGPDKLVLRTEYMSSFTKKFENIYECKEYVNSLCHLLKSKIIRVKIESPFYEEYIDKSLYMESHFNPFNLNYPISRNQRSQKLIATDRTNNKLSYNDFRKKWENEDVELCLYDSFIEEDRDWFDLYKK